MGLISTLKHLVTYADSEERYWDIRCKAKAAPKLLRYWYLLQHRKIMIRNSAGIAVASQIENMPQFPHGLHGIFVSSGAKIGKNAVIFHQVTIGSNTLKGSKNQGAPTIGDNVYIGCGAKIIGGIRIGNNVRIGANCVVTEDVPDNATVVLERPRVIVHETPRDNSFVMWGDYLAEQKVAEQ